MKKFFIISLFAAFFSAGIANADMVFECKKCKGSGYITDYQSVTCPTCHGRKKVCFSCKGTRRHWDGSTCLACLGSGMDTCWTCVNTGTKGRTVRVECPQCKGRGHFSL